MDLKAKLESIIIGLRQLQAQREREAQQLQQTDDNILRQEGAILLLQQMIAEQQAAATPIEPTAETT